MAASSFIITSFFEYTTLSFAMQVQETEAFRSNQKHFYVTVYPQMCYTKAKNTGDKLMLDDYMTKTEAVLSVMQRTQSGRFIVEKKMNELESLGRIRFVEDPRDTRRKLISKEHVEEVVRALTTI
jgi:hypothetical protein